MEPKILRIQQAIDRTYEYTILDNIRKDLSTLHNIRMDINCISCNQEGQYYWQTKDKTRLEFYCPNCNITWTIFQKHKEALS
jgi:Zn finger protein HypA/HybF involved in hydrogenase expression